VFYEYLYAVGDKNSARASRCVTAVLVLLGLLLSMPHHHGHFVIEPIDPIWPLITCGLSALVGLFISISLGGKFSPVPNANVLRLAPISMLQSALYPALALAAPALLWPAAFTPAPLFTGLLLYEACRTPFRRSPLESEPMNRLLLIIAAASLICLVAFQFIIKASFSAGVVMTCLALLIAALAYSMRVCWRKFYIENPELNVQEIIVTETQNYSGPKVDGKVSIHTILSELGVETDLNNNIIDLDIRQIRERLEQEPILKNIEVRKIMPHTLSISFDERTPQAVVFCGRKSCYIDQDAIVLPLRHNDDTQMKYDTTGLPIITAVQNPDGGCVIHMRAIWCGPNPDP
jgi:hypothetical protein